MPILLIILILLWFFGYIKIPWFTIPRFPLFTINNYTVTFYDVIIFIVAAWAISFLPSPLREIGGILLIIWALSTLGIFFFGGLSQIIMIALIIGIAISLFR